MIKFLAFLFLSFVGALGVVYERSEEFYNEDSIAESANVIRFQPWVVVINSGLDTDCNRGYPDQMVPVGFCMDFLEPHLLWPPDLYDHGVRWLDGRSIRPDCQIYAMEPNNPKGAIEAVLACETIENEKQDDLASMYCNDGDKHRYLGVTTDQEDYYWRSHGVKLCSKTKQ